MYFKDIPPMSQERVNAANDFLSRVGNDVDNIFRDVSKRINPLMYDSDYLPYLLASKMTPERAKIILALPDTGWNEGMGMHDVSDEFVASLDMDPDFVREQIKISHISGDIKCYSGKGPDIINDFALWGDLQFHPDWVEKHGPGYYAVISIMLKEEFQPQMEIAITYKRGKGNFSSSRTRIIPRYDSVKDHPELLDVENYKEVLKSRQTVYQKPCYCRWFNEEFGQDSNVCMVSKDHEELFDAMGPGEFKPWEEVFEYIQEKGKEEPMVSIGKNTKNIEKIDSDLCNCNMETCFIGQHTRVTGGQYKIWDYYTKSRFRATLDIETCAECGECHESRCMFNAIQRKYYRNMGRHDIYVNEMQCMGCGCCVETCPSGALTMKLVDSIDTFRD